jgi:hypothetical protein
MHSRSTNVFGSTFVLTEKAWHYAEAAWRADAAVIEHEPTGWQAVDVGVGNLREMMAGARDHHDFKAVGHQCVAVLEAVARELFDPSRHLPAGEVEPSPNDVKRRVEMYINAEAPGKDLSHVRKIAKAAYDQGHSVKHRTSPDAADAGIATDAVILLVSMLRRLAGPADGRSPA